MYACFNAALISLLIPCVLTLVPTLGPEYKFERDGIEATSICCKLESYTATLRFLILYTYVPCLRSILFSFSFFSYRVNYVSRVLRREESYSKTATSGAMDNYYSRCCRNFASSCVFIAQLKYFSCISPVINFTGKNMKVIYLQKEYFKMSAFFNFHGERYNN